MIIIYVETYWEGIHGFPLYFLFLTLEKNQAQDERAWSLEKA